MSSIYVDYWIFLQNFSNLIIFAYRQTGWTLIRLLLEEQSDLGPHCLQKWLLKSQADDKVDEQTTVVVTDSLRVKTRQQNSFFLFFF